MTQYRQYNSSSSSTTANNHHSYTNGGGAAVNAAAAADHVSVGIRGHHKKSLQHRRLKSRRISVGTAVAFVCFVFAASAFAFAFVYLSPFDHSDNNTSKFQDEAFRDDFLTNVTRFNTPKVKFGHGSAIHGRDSRYWDGDDRRRDEDYNEDEKYKSSRNSEHAIRKGQIPVDVKSRAKKPNNGMQRGADHQGLYNEAGRNELRMYEAKYEASLKNVGQMGAETEGVNHASNDSKLNVENEQIDDIDDEYDDGIDSHDTHADDYDDSRRENMMHSELTNSGGNQADVREGSILVDQSSSQDSSAKSHSDNNHGKNGDAYTADELPNASGAKRPKKHRKHHSSSACAMKLLNSTAHLVEPSESRKFARFSLSYTQKEEKPDGVDQWEPRFAGHQSLREREDSFIAREQTINCGFVKGSKEYSGTGFDLAEDDYRYIGKCHIAVVSCIFGNSDRLRSPFTKAVSRLSRKNVCFVMFMDESTLQTLSSEGQIPDRMGYIGLWKAVVVKNLPFTDMRRVGKIPKLLTHRLFPSARYSIWLDSKLRLQRDPLLLLENFLWRKGNEYAISNHYDRHCVWEEVERNKKLNKFNHTMIDQQFQFYQADGLKRFNASDPNKLLPSNVPEGSMIIRAHTPMSNLFSCLWFNEVDRFTPRDQLSFAYTYQKLRKKNPTRPFYLHMFKDCERRRIAKLFHHRADERLNTAQLVSE